MFCRGVRCPVCSVGMYFVLCVLLGCTLSSVCSVEVYFLLCALSGFTLSCVVCRGVLCPVCSLGVYVLVYVTFCGYLKVNGVPSPCCGGKPCWADTPCCGVVTYLVMETCHVVVACVPCCGDVPYYDLPCYGDVPCCGGVRTLLW